ncbi:MAG: glycosyltransferase family 2 protein [Bacteroidaceae bacterium]|nr:glycosyltransferase family 2 protein [Bacteroidaceae bacterium]
MPWIDRCLPSLMQSSQPTDILVIDNASSDETLAHIREYYPQVRLIANTQNLGFGAANNIGMKMALDEGYEGVLLINQDAWLEPDALQQLVDASLQHPEYGIISPMHLTGDGNSLDPGFAKYIEDGTLKIENCHADDKKRSRSMVNGHFSEQREQSDACISYAESRRNRTQSMVNLHFLEQREQSQTCLSYAESRQNRSAAQSSIFINAALWYVPTDVVRKVGMFAPLFYHYGEDKDYVNRVHYHGYQIGYVPTAIGYHDRAERPFTHELFIRTERVYHLSEYANINYSFGKAFALGVLAPVKKAFKALANGRWSNFTAFIGISFQLLVKTFQIINSRKEAKSYTPNP